MPKQEKTPMSRLPVTSLGISWRLALGLSVMSQEVQRQSLEVLQVLTSVVFLAWARQAYTFSGLDFFCFKLQV
jgi:hypothetical protein